MNIHEQPDYKTFAIYTSLTHSTIAKVEINSNDYDAMRHSHVLSGNVHDENISAYNTADYDYQLLDPYVHSGVDELESWGKYFSDMFYEIKANVSRRNGNAIPLDFANVIILIASLSSLITLHSSDITKHPKLNARYLQLASKENAAQQQANLLKQDPILFKWFVCEFLLPNDSSCEDIAAAFYTTLRCGLIHNMTIGKLNGGPGADNEITLASENPYINNTNWYEIKDDSRCYSFYLKELMDVIGELLKDLFDKNTTNHSMKRFQQDASLVLAGKSPVKLLKATKKVIDKSH